MIDPVIHVVPKRWRPRLNSRKLCVITLAFLFVFFVLTLPVLCYSHPPFVDFPLHLARHYIESVLKENLYQEHATYIQQYYDFEWHPIPYLATNFFYLPFTQIMSVYSAAKLVTIIIILLWLLAPMVIYRVLWGHYSIWPLFSALVVYNANLTFGFENYVLSAPLAILAFGLWIGWAKQLSTTRLIVFTAIATILYFAHLVAFALFGLLVLSYETGRLVRNREATLQSGSRLLLCGLPFVIGTLLFLFLVVRRLPLHSGSSTSFGTIQDRLLVFGSPVLEFGSQGTIVMSALNIVVLIFVFFVGWREKGWLRIAPSMVPVVVVLGIIALVMPKVLFGAWFANFRIPVVFVVLLIGATCWVGVPRRAVKAFAIFVGILLVTSVIVRLDSWKTHDREEREIISAFRKLNRGAKLLVAEYPDFHEPLHWHSASYAVIERQVFLSTIFPTSDLTGRTSLRPKPGIRHIDYPGPVPVNVLMLARSDANSTNNAAANAAAVDRRYPWSTWWQDYSDVLIFSRRSKGYPIPRLLEVIYKGSFFILYHNRCFDARNIHKKSIGKRNDICLTRSP
jgi:hypothetical protein